MCSYIHMYKCLCVHAYAYIFMSPYIHINVIVFIFIHAYFCCMCSYTHMSVCFIYPYIHNVCFKHTQSRIQMSLCTVYCMFIWHFGTCSTSEHALSCLTTSAAPSFIPCLTTTRC